MANTLQSDPSPTSPPANVPVTKDVASKTAASASASGASATATTTTGAEGAGFQNSASLYVGELLPEITEAMLFEMFSQVGSVASIRVCRDAVTRRSLGYAYTNFHNIADAERAMEAFNYQPIKGKVCRIMWSQRDPAMRKAGSGNIFIKNLDKAIDNKALHDTFAAFGNILSCKIALDEAGESKGYGFVHYETAEAANAAIENVNGMLLNDKKVYVDHHVPRRERDNKGDEAKKTFTNLFVKNLDEGVTEAALTELFAPFGNITSLAISCETEAPHKSRGFGFLNFDSHTAAAAAVAALHDKEFHGKPLFVGRAQKKGEREEELRRHFEALKLEKESKFAGVNLYVKNLDDVIDDERLRVEFAAYGTITSAKVMRDERDASRGFGFVCFSNAEEASKAVAEMNNRMVGSKPIYVAVHQKKDQRKQQLEAQHAQRNMSRGLQQPMMGPMGAMQYAPMYYQGAGMAQGPPRSQFIYPPQMGGFPRPRFAGPNGAPGSAAGPGQSPMGRGQPQPGMPFAMPMQPGMYPPQGQPGRQGSMQGGAPQGPGPRGPMGPSVVMPGQGYVNGTMTGQNQSASVAASAAKRPPYKFTTGARNQPIRDGSGGPGASEGGSSEPSLTTLLASMPPPQQKQTLGERLYPAVQNELAIKDKRDLAGKVTGMLLEMDNSELLHLLEDSEALKDKVGEALEVLERHFAAHQEKVKKDESSAKETA